MMFGGRWDSVSTRHAGPRTVMSTGVGSHCPRARHNHRVRNSVRPRAGRLGRQAATEQSGVWGWRRSPHGAFDYTRPADYHERSAAMLSTIQNKDIVRDGWYE